MTDDVVLAVSEVEQAYGSVSVLEGASFELTAGTVTALLGPNGSGKTTLLRAITGLYRPDAGRIVYRGPDVPRRLGYLPQQPRFRPGFTALETLTYYVELAGERSSEANGEPTSDPPTVTELARSYLERVGLAAAAEKNVETLSGGMTRLLGIAQATVGDPPVIVLDEPASGLDPGMSVRIFDVAAELADAGGAVLLSSHDLSLVERRADRIVLLEDGEIALEGDAETIVEDLDVDTLLEAYEQTIAGDIRTVRVRGENA